MKDVIDNKYDVIPQHTQDIKGWGVDADPENNPTYPIKRYNGADHKRMNYDRSSQQEASVEVLHSNERPGLTRVFGTSSPPSGLSGMLRRFAFGFSEGSSGHWLTLLLADRVNVFEGIADDLRTGHFPNILSERGWNAEWKYNRPAVIRKAMIGTAIAAAALTIILIRRNKKRRTV